MKLKFIILGLSLLIINLPINAQNWTPLEIGNKWQYFSQIYFYNTPWPSLTNVEVFKDTLVNNKIYYWMKSVRQGYWASIDSSLQRYESDNKMLYAFDFSGDSEYMLMDFNLEAGDTLPPTPYTDYFFRTVIAGTDYLFGNPIYYKGYKEYTFFYYGSYQLSKYTTDFGYYYGYSFNHVPGIGEYDTDAQLIQSIININGVFQNNSHQKYPLIDFDPVTRLPDSLFQISFNVDHYYSRKYLPYGGNDSLLFNYVDSVSIENYYSNSITNINNQPILVSNLTNEKEYLLDTVLNLNLLTNGYNFYYRIKAVDKGIIAHTTFSPVSGYYEVIYDTTSGVNDLDHQSMTFDLNQNYPNPFNPSTEISWQSPVGSWQTLKVYDILGNEIATLVDEYRPAGSYEIEFNPESSIKNPASGVYFYQLIAGDFVATKKMILIK
jgi:hypothetical protein